MPDATAPAAGGPAGPVRPGAIPQDELAGYVREAVRISREHVARGGIPFSAMVVAGGRVLGTGFNRVREDGDPTAHAEVVALRAASAGHGLHATGGAALIASGEPCALCYTAALYFGVGRIVYAADRATAARYGFDYSRSYELFAQDPSAWQIEVTCLPVPDGTRPFAEFLAADRGRA